MTMTVLVIDHSSVVTEPIAYILKQRGCNTFVASNATDAAARLQQTPIDIILLDLMLPDSGAKRLMRQLRDSAAHALTPVILLADSQHPRLTLETASIGIQGYIFKDRFSLTELFDKLDSLTTLHKLNKPDHPNQTVQHNPGTPPQSQCRPTPTVTQSNTHTTTAPLTTPPESVSDLKPIMKRSDIVQRIEQHCDLRALAGTTGQLNKLAKSDNSSLDDIISVLKRDQAISFKIMRVANSAAYDRGRTVESVRQAVMNVGIRQVSDIALSIAVMEFFSEQSQRSAVDAFRLWEHNIAVAIISASLANTLEFGRNGTDTLFTAGLLHDVGRLVFAKAFTDDYTRITQFATQFNVPVETVERRMLLYSHAEIMNKLLTKWQFPNDLIDPISLHHDPLQRIRNLAGKRWKECATLALADRLTHAMAIGSSSNDIIYTLAPFTHALQVQPDTIEEIQLTIRDQVTDLRSAMLARRGPPPSSYIQELNQTLHSTPKPLLIADSPSTDPFHIFIQSAWANASKAKPRCAIVHIEKPGNRIPLSKTLIDNERKAGIPPLPVIVLSENGNLDLDTSIVEERSTLTLATPTPFNLLIQAITQFSGTPSAQQETAIPSMTQ